MSSSLGIIKEIFIYTSKTGKSILFFLLESTIFFIISLIIGFFISISIFSLGTGDLISVYKQVVSLGLVFTVISFFVYRFIKAFIEEWRILSFSDLTINQKRLLCFIYSSSSLVPRWFAFISTLLFWIFLIIISSFILWMISYLALGFLISYFNISSETIIYIYNGLFKLGNILKAFAFNLYENTESDIQLNSLSSTFWWTVIIFLETIFIMSLFDGKLILKKIFKSKDNDKVSTSAVFRGSAFAIWYLLLVSCHLIFIYVLIYVFIFYRSISLIIE